MRSCPAIRIGQRVAGGGGRLVAACNWRVFLSVSVLLVLNLARLQNVEASVQIMTGRADCVSNVYLARVGHLFALPLTRKLLGLLTGRVLILMSSLPGGKDPTQFYLQTDDNQFFRLAFCSSVDVEQIIPNSRVVVEFDEMSNGVLSTCKLPREESSRRILFGDSITTPTEPTFLIYLVTLCGYNEPAAATEEVSASA